MYALLDSGQGRKLEQFGDYVLDRPDPQILWQKLHPELWENADAIFDENWYKKNNLMPDEWQVEVSDLRVWAKLTPFKHTGIFPEQQEQWSFINDQVTSHKAQMSVLNLFGYTGIASLIAAKAGASVTYVDASKQALTWARKNQEVSNLIDKPIRWILDDVLKFVTREVKRGNKYSGLILDPPAYGHGPNGETWQFNKSLPELVNLCQQILAPDCKLIIINAYAVSTSSVTLNNLLQDMTKNLSGVIEHGELVLNSKDRELSTGIFAKWCAS